MEQSTSQTALIATIQALEQALSQLGRASRLRHNKLYDMRARLGELQRQLRIASLDQQQLRERLPEALAAAAASVDAVNPSVLTAEAAMSLSQQADQLRQLASGGLIEAYRRRVVARLSRLIGGLESTIARAAQQHEQQASIEASLRQALEQLRTQRDAAEQAAAADAARQQEQ